MSSGKRLPAKQKRAAQNRQQRAALEARKAAAAEAASAGGGSAGRGGRGGGLFSRLLGGAPAARTVSGSSNGGSRPARGPAARADQPIGFRAALAALIAAAAAVVLTIVQTTPVNADGDLYTQERLVAEWATTAASAAGGQSGTDAGSLADSIEEWAPGRGSERLIAALWPASATMALPLLAAALAFRAVQQRRPSKTVNRAMYATLFGALLTFNLFIFFLPAVVAVSIAGFQVRKAEVQALAAAREADGEGSDDGDVIDVDAVDDTAPDSDPDSDSGQ